jgi:transcriptional regulator with XRE-family HTH domain
MTPNASEIGARLHGARLLAGLSQREMADRLGRDRTTIGRWESGGLVINAVQLAEYCDVVGAEPCQVLAASTS